MFFFFIYNKEMMEDSFLKVLYPDSPNIRDFLVGIYDDGNTSYVSCIIQLLFHIKSIRSIEFPPDSIFSKIIKKFCHYTGQSAISIQFFLEYVKNEMRYESQDPAKLLIELLQHIPQDVPLFQFDTIRQMCNDHTNLVNPDFFPILELSICSNSDDYLRRHSPDEFFSTFTESLNDFFGTPQNKKIEDGYKDAYFNIKIDEISNHILIKLKRFYKFYSVVDTIFKPFSIPNFINLKNYMLNNDDIIFQLKSIIFYNYSIRTRSQFSILYKIKDHWVLFDNEKVTFPEFENEDIISALNSSIRKGSYLLLYKRNFGATNNHENFSIEHKEIPQNIEQPDSDISFSDDDVQYNAVRHSNFLENTFIVSSMFPNLFGILSVDPVGVPSKPIGTVPQTNSLFGMFIRTCSQQLADKAFLKNDIGQDNVDLINRRIYGDIIEDDNITNILELSEFLNNIYSECMIANKVDNLMITRTIGSLKNMFSLTEINDDIFNDEFFTFDNYKWRERLTVLNLSKTIDELLKINNRTKSKSSKVKKTQEEKETKRQAKQEEFNRIHSSFIQSLKNAEINPGIKINGTDFCKNYYNNRLNGSIQGDCVPSYNTLKKWFVEYHHGNNFQNKTQGGRREKHVKLTPDVISCLICTLVDFPTWTIIQRTMYINGINGATDKDIKVSTIERACQNLKFTVHTTRYSPPARNSVGLRSLRILWARYVSKLIQTGSTCFVFMDEAGLSFMPRNKKCRGFIGVTPLTLRNLQFSRISVVAAVIPGYGIIYQWSDGKSVKGTQYKNFLCEVINIIRRFIGTGATKIALIHDNASIHWTKEVTDFIRHENIELIPTIPYSPQLNYLVECYFGIIKSILANIDIPPVVDDQIIDMIKFRWDVETRRHFNGQTTSKMFDEWASILDDCCQGLPLNNDGHHSHNVDHIEYLRGFQTYRILSSSFNK